MATCILTRHLHLCLTTQLAAGLYVCCHSSPFNKSSLKRIVADLTLLDDMAAQLILHNLKKRFEKGACQGALSEQIGACAARLHVATAARGWQQALSADMGCPPLAIAAAPAPQQMQSPIHATQLVVAHTAS